jgi:succinate dehydrogenase (ubiquinone) cytochrome b560 subunit
MISQFAMQRALAPAAIGASIQTRFVPLTSLPSPIVGVRGLIRRRPVATQKFTPESSYEILVQQRKQRPTSPHLTVYQPQIPWVLSMTHRLTGAVLSGGLYIFGSAYLVAPLFGWHLDSATLAAAFASWPVVLKVATKFAVAMPFTFHGFNGLRHLVWDFGKGFKNQAVIRTGWTVVGLSVTSALALATLI